MAKEGNIEKAGNINIIEILQNPSLKYKEIIDRVQKDHKERIQKLPEFARMGLSFSHSASFIPFLYKEGERQNAIQSLAEIFDKYHYNEFSEELYKYLASKLTGQLVINLAAGDDTALSATLSKFEPAAIVNVDMGYQSGIKPGYFPKTVEIGEDILSFIARLPDNCCCVTISGFDAHIVPFNEYHEALQKEICRVLTPGGIVFGNKASALDEASKNPLLKKIIIENISSNDMIIFEKVIEAK